MKSFKIITKREHYFCFQFEIYADDTERTIKKK